MSTSEERLKLLSLKEVFAEGTRSFTIPDYQRGYSWEEHQREDLLKDITYGIEGGYLHYIGTLVVAKSQYRDVYEIVDGQQRLTTLIILLSCLAHAFRRINKEAPRNLRRFYIEEGSEAGNTRPKFKLSSDHHELFQKLDNDPECRVIANSKGDQNIVDAFAQFKRWFQEYSDEETITEVYDYVTTKLGFLMYAPNRTKEIGIMFEVINNRGKQLSELEKVKNYLMYFSEKNDIQDLRSTVLKKWPRILDHLNSCNLTSNDDENAFLRNCWIVFHDTNKNRSFYVYENLKANFPTTEKGNWKSLDNFVSFLEESAHTYRKLFTRKDVFDQHEEICLTRLGNQPVLASVLPLTLAIFSRETELSARINLLRLIEKLNFRFYGTGIASRSDSGQGELYRLAHEFYNLHSSTRADLTLIDASWLDKQLREFVNSKANDPKMVKYLTLDHDESGDYYSWRWLKYFLASYEGNLERLEKRGETLVEKLAPRDDLRPNDFYTIEHIWAVKDKDPHGIFESSYLNNGGLDVNKRRLGNFVLLRERINLSIQNTPPEEKVEKYFENIEDAPDTIMIRELKGLFYDAREELKRRGWKRKTRRYWYEVYAKFLDFHEEKYVNFALARWRVDGTSRPVKAVTLDSLSGTNEIYKLKYVDV